MCIFIDVRASLKQDAHNELCENGWGSQIKSYVFHPYQMVKDVRSGFERGDIESVLDGDLDPFLEASIMHFRSIK